MRQRFFSSILLLTFFSFCAAQQTIPVYREPAAGVFLRQWLLCGPFPNPLPQGVNEYRFDSTSTGHYLDYLLAHGGEGKIRPYEGMETRHPDGRKLKWKMFASPFGLITLDEVMVPSIEGVAYAYCIVRASKDTKMVLSVTSNDGIRIWQNGVRILEHNTMGSEEPDRDMLAVLLKKGDNHFCVKTSQGRGKWSFQFRFLDYASTARQVEKSIHLYLRPEVTQSANAYQIFAGQRYKIELLQKKIPARITILSPDGKKTIAHFNTFLGQTVAIKKAALGSAQGLYTVQCAVTIPGGEEHSLRNYFYRGQAPSIAATYAAFKKIPLPDTSSFLGRQVFNNYQCMDFQLADDMKAGNLPEMDAATQQDVTKRFERWMCEVQNASTAYHKIFPEIRDIKIQTGKPFNPEKELVITDLTGGKMKADIDRITATLDRRGTSWKNAAQGNLVFGLEKDFPDQLVNKLPGDESYTILVKDNQVKVIGGGWRGLHYGLVTLKQLLEMNTALPAATLFDVPAAAHRATFQYLPLPITDSFKNRVLEYVDLKYNEIVVRSSDYRRMNDPAVVEGLKEWFAFIRSFHIEPIPLLWIGSNSAWEEGFSLENEPVVFQGDHLQFAFQRLVNLNDSRPRLSSAPSGGITYLPGKDYRIVAEAPAEIERLPQGRIAPNAKLYLTADIIDARAHRFSKPCPSEEAAYEEFDSLVQPIIRHLQPATLHVNHDEVGLVNSDSRCLQRKMTPAELMAYQVNRMRDIIKKYDAGVDMIMWADCVNPFHNAGLKMLEDVGTLLKKDIIMAHWFYTAEDFKQKDLLDKGTEFLLKKGFRTYGSPWDHLVNHQAWENILLQHTGDRNFWGLMHTEWYGKERSRGLSQTAAINWQGKTWLTK